MCIKRTYYRYAIYLYSRAKPNLTIAYETHITLNKMKNIILIEGKGIIPVIIVLVKMLRLEPLFGHLSYI